MHRRAGRGGPCAATAAVAAGLSLAACGAGAGPGLSRFVQLRVSTGFGARTLLSRSVGHAPVGWSVMTLTQRFARLKTSDGGDFVDAIDGHANDEAGVARRDWFFYVNGMQGSVGAAAMALRAGDRVWWDLHDWQAAESIPAVVGDFPAPFSTARRPTRVVCVGSGVTPACDSATAALRRSGVRVIRADAPADGQLTVLVGTDAALALGLGDAAIAQLDQSPSESGVYGRFLPGGGALELENQTGSVSTTLHGSVGLIAALDPTGSPSATWVITGTTATGVRNAARQLRSASLAGRFAIAVSSAGTAIPLPTG